MPLNLAILDVGQSASMAAWLPDGKVMMIDGESTRNKGLTSTESSRYSAVLPSSRTRASPSTGLG
jgi:hypothetical protein